MPGRPAKSRVQWNARVDPSWSLDARIKRLCPGIKERGDALLALVERAEQGQGIGTLMDAFRDDPMDDVKIQC
jgi:hypothetical protein